MSGLQRLSSAILPTLKAAGKVATPKFNPKDIKPGILHLGVGNFHRSHVAAYMNDLFNNDALVESHKDWGIVGGGIMHFDDAKRKQLEPQDWMQTLVEIDADGTKPQLLTSMIDFLPVDHEGKKHEALQDMLMKVKIVSLTVTEGGYYLNDGKFDLGHAHIQHDIANPDSPQTIFGMMLKALKLRREAGVAPFTIMSCDNIPHNGKVVEGVVVGLAKEMYDEEFVAWLEDNVAFPNSMVDRITPATTESQKKFVKDNYGYEDDAPIFCEPYRQWVLEDNFTDGRPEFEKIDPSITFVDDVAPYELMKIRILNGGHASLSYPAALLSLEYVHDAMEHPLIGKFLDIVEKTEIIPTIPPVPGTDLADYWKLINSRFSNPAMGDTIGRNTYDGASRQPKFIVPVAADGLKKGTKVDGLALVSAMWCRYCQGTVENGDEVPSKDPQWDRLTETAEEAKTNPAAWLAMEDVYGAVGQDPVFQEAFAKALNTINSKGVEAALQQYIDENESFAAAA